MSVINRPSAVFGIKYAEIPVITRKSLELERSFSLGLHSARDEYGVFIVEDHTIGSGQKQVMFTNGYAWQEPIDIPADIAGCLPKDLKLIRVDVKVARIGGGALRLYCLTEEDLVLVTIVTYSPHVATQLPNWLEDKGLRVDGDERLMWSYLAMYGVPHMPEWQTKSLLTATSS